MQISLYHELFQYLGFWPVVGVDFSAALLGDVEEGEVEDCLVVVDGLVLLHLRDLRVGQEAKNVPW